MNNTPYERFSQDYYNIAILLKLDPDNDDLMNQRSLLLHEFHNFRDTCKHEFGTYPNSKQCQLCKYINHKIVNE